MPAVLGFSHGVGTFSKAGYSWCLVGRRRPLGSTAYPTNVHDYTSTFYRFVEANDKRHDCAIERKKRCTSWLPRCWLWRESENKSLGINCVCVSSFKPQQRRVFRSLWELLQGRRKKREYLCPCVAFACVCVCVWTPTRTGKTFAMTGSTPADMVRGFTVSFSQFTIYIHLFLQDFAQ